MEPISSEGLLPDLNAWIRERIRMHGERQREQLVARLTAGGDPDWIMSVFNEQG
jgi:hypothetical protein